QRVGEGGGRDAGPGREALAQGQQEIGDLLGRQQPVVVEVVLAAVARDAASRGVALVARLLQRQRRDLVQQRSFFVLGQEAAAVEQAGRQRRVRRGELLVGEQRGL